MQYHNNIYQKELHWFIKTVRTHHNLQLLILHLSKLHKLYALNLGTIVLKLFLILIMLLLSHFQIKYHYLPQFIHYKGKRYTVCPMGHPVLSRKHYNISNTLESLTYDFTMLLLS